jgi:glycosyltransferase involved in cell wall biosynthesis
MKASIFLLAYNQARFVAEAVRSAMAQDYSDLELVVCDDSSSDDTRKIIEEELRHCPAHISVVRVHTTNNIGLLANFNQGMAACTGEFVMVMAGDDISMPHRVSRIAAEFAANPQCMLVYSNWQQIDDEGQPFPGTCRHLQDTTFAHTPRPTCVYAGGKGPGSTAAYRAEVFRTFGPLEITRRPEDRSSWVRALLLGEIHYLMEPLVKWRTHTANLSNYIAETDNAPNRKRILRDLLHRQCYGRQFRKDITLAERSSLIAPVFARRLEFIIAHDRERERLRRFALAQAPWKLCLGSARRLIKISPSPKTLLSIVFNEFPIRLSRKRRERRWAKRISKRRD